MHDGGECREGLVKMYENGQLRSVALSRWPISRLP